MSEKKANDQSYPERKQGTCQFCKSTAEYERRGDGQEWRGRLNYWYVTTHQCSEKAALRRELNGQSAVMRSATIVPK